MQSGRDRLLWTAAQKRSLYTFNVRDYRRSHGEFIAQSNPMQGLFCQATTLLSRRANAEAAQTDRYQAGGGNDKQDRVSQRLGMIEAPAVGAVTSAFVSADPPACWTLDVTEGF